MTNLLTESTSNIVNELLDDIKENIIQINDNCMSLFCMSNRIDFCFVILAEQIQLNTVKPTNITNLLEKKLLIHDQGLTNETPTDTTSPLILMNKQLELIHPLEHQWSFWYLKNQQGKDWQENLMKLATFGYVEEFWA